MKESTENAAARGFDSFQMKLGDLMRGERATLGKSLLDVQRDLRIKAAYIAAIENCDPTVFQTPGFIAGHVRSYARYLDLDPDMVFSMFCTESDFNGVHADARQKKSLGGFGELAGFGEVVVGNTATAKSHKQVAANFNSFPDPISDTRGNNSLGSEGYFSRTPLSSLGSLAVLLLLILGLGYGAWTVLQDIQRVEFAPNDQNMVDVVGLTGDTNTAARPSSLIESRPETANLQRLYRPRELDVPVLVARDGPISQLDPDRIGALIPGGGIVVVPEPVDTTDSGPKVVENPAPVVTIVAARAAWVRVSQSDGTVLFEKILNAGESFKLPSGVQPPVLRAGNSGFVFVTVGDETFGPIGDGTSVAKHISLAEMDIRDDYAAVRDIDQLRLLENPKVITLNQSAPDNP